MGGVGSGAKPKTYPDALVAKVRELYAAGRTQDEIGSALGLSQHVIWRLMQRHGIASRVAAKRDQRGSANDSWKGNAATYTACHLRVEAKYGKPMKCERCGTDDPQRTYDWANQTGDYHDPDDYRRMCRSCHRRFDMARRKGLPTDAAQPSQSV
jgi:hypothetical protein